VTNGRRALHDHARAILDHELRRARKGLAKLPEERRSALEYEAARVIAAVVDSMIEEARREPSLGRALASIYGIEPGWEPRLVSLAAD
jgi:F0F1-type ATP synthase membrane subunit b/b'